MIQPVNALTPKVLFKGGLKEAETPYSEKVEKNIALINAIGISTAIGAAMTAISRGYTSGWKQSGLVGLGTALVSTTFLIPRFLYKAGIKNGIQPQDVDVFAKEKDMPKKLLSDNKRKSISSKIKNFIKK